AGTNLTRVSDVAEITFTADADVSEAVVFDGLESGTYYVAATDAAGNLLTIADVQGELLSDEEIQTEETEEQRAEAENMTEETEAQTAATETDELLDSETGEDAGENQLTADDGSLAATVAVVTLSEDAQAAGTAMLQYQYTAAWPEDLFYYSVKLSITLNVTDRDGSALAGSEKFYMNIYSDDEMTTAVNDSPIKFSMGGESTKTKSYKLKVTSPQQTFYLGETDSAGALVTTGENGFAYIMSLEGANELIVTTADTSVSVTAENRLNDS
ncbi:MAG: hypothetical protein LUF30_02305, partial [Lachnospiraceae bacterium]|nr:hypothetical protein [Lachnospiraceae bacterium]